MLKQLYIDIETAPAKAYIWDLKTRYVPVSQVAEDGYILCFAYSWEGDEDIYISSRWDHGEDAMVNLAWRLLDEADSVVHYNGNNFDIPRLNTEFLRHRLGPPSPSFQVDLYSAVRSKFRVLSRSMNHMLSILDLESKMQHKGMDLWYGCMNGLKEDQKLMEEYNVRDVEALAELYHELLPWINNHPNVALWMDRKDDGSIICPRCGSEDLRFKGYKRTKVLNYKQYKCNGCGFYPRERYAEDTGKARRTDVLTW